MNNSADAGIVAAVETKFTWCIENISELCKLRRIVSPVFKMTINNIKTKWRLLLLEKDEESQDGDDDDEEYLGVYLETLNSDSIKATVNFYMLNAFKNREMNRKTLENQEFEPGHCCGFTDYIERKILQERKDKVRGEEELRLAEFNKFEKLFMKQDFSDIVFDVEGKEIHAHKCIVANRSPVFEAMFTHDTTEAQNNRVEISDVSYLAMRDLLRYIYTGRIPVYIKAKAEKSFMDLLVAAEKYCIDNLKCECEKRLSEFLEVDNIFEYLNFSDTHNASHLKEEVMEYMVDHGKEIVALPGFKKSCSELHADVVSEVFRALVIKKRKVE